LNADDIVCQHHATLLAVLKNLDDIAANRVQPMVDDVTLAERAVGEAVEHLQELASELKLEGRFFTLRAYRRIGQHRRDITVSWQSKSGSLPTQIGPNLTARELAEVLVELRQG
jgi:7-keto-8-aminopelargonate synthetase-like enzyme